MLQTPTAGTQHPGPAAGKQHQSHSSCCLTLLLLLFVVVSRTQFVLLLFFIYLFLLLLHNTLQLPTKRPNPGHRGCLFDTLKFVATVSAFADHTLPTDHTQEA